jgi:hypothetical protein
MTLLTKPIKRELPQTFDRRSWIIELQPWGINFRAKRTRKSFPITWDSIFNRTMLIAAESERREKAERRKLRRAA